MATDKKIDNLILNRLTKEQYESIANPDPDQLYFVPENEPISAAEWGNITGTLSNQTDLMTAFNGKAGKADLLDLANTVSGLNNTKVDKVAGKVLSSNDFTNTDKTKLDSVESNAQANVIEGVQVNGTNLNVVNKKVNVPLASTSGAGVVGVSSTYRTGMTGNYIYAGTTTAANYASEDSKIFISKGTLDNLIAADATVSDSGWMKCTLSSQFKAYGSTSHPQIRKIGKMVELNGACSPTAEITPTTSGTEYTMFTIPSGYRPPASLAFVCQGSDMNKWTLRVKSNGEATIRSYGVSSAINIPTTAWLPFTVIWMVD